MNQEKARQLVHDYVKGQGNSPDGFALSDVYVVWWSKTLQNSKALLSTTIPDSMYYELTYNGSKGEIYFDAYTKTDNFVIADRIAVVQNTNAGPHSRSCKNKPHSHGPECHVSCPTCHAMIRL